MIHKFFSIIKLTKPLHIELITWQLLSDLTNHNVTGKGFEGERVFAIERLNFGRKNCEVESQIIENNQSIPCQEKVRGHLVTVTPSPLCLKLIN